MSDPEIQAKFSALVVVCMLCAISTGQVHAEIRPVRDVQKALADQGLELARENCTARISGISA